MVLGRDFFERPVEEVAPSLLGCLFSHRTAEGEVAVRLTEVEAYAGALDPASHAFRGRTPRNTVMFGEPGHAYVYFTYGMHFCVNLVCGPDDVASAVLLRAGEVMAGAELVRARRPRSTVRDFSRGPARLCQAMGIAREQNGLDVCDPGSALRILPGEPVAARRIRTGPRVGVSSAKELPWRYWVDGEPSVSVYKAHAPKRRART